MSRAVCLKYVWRVLDRLVRVVLTDRATRVIVAGLYQRCGFFVLVAVPAEPGHC